MLRKMGVIGSLMLLSLALTAFTPLQAEEGGITNYWWSIIIIVAFILILFLILSVLFAYREAPSVDELNAQAEQEAAEKEARRAAREAEAAQAAAAAEETVNDKAPDVSTAAAAEPAVAAPEAAAEPEPEPEPEASPEPAAPVADVEPDDLKKIEGIGPKVSQLLVEAGIKTFAALADADQPTLQKVLDDAGSRYRIIDPATWPAQAKLAAEGRWDDLETLQDNLKGGRQIS